MRTCLLFILLLGSRAAFAQPAKPELRTVKLGEHTFTLPKGFTVEKVAGAPQIERPVNGCFDEQGRLYVTDSSGSNDRPAEQIKNPTHRVVRLESSKKDGAFDKSVVFADKLSFLQGALWYKGSLYVAAPPVILKLTDTDGDGVADKREVWFDGKALTGCANDVHGPYLGPDEKIYWTRGGFGTAEYNLKDGKKFKTRASHIFRADPDGKNLEIVMTGGMDNPVGVAWVGPELFFSTTFLQHPEAGKRDGLIHNTYGALYGKHHDELEEYIRPGPKLSEPMTHLGPAAPSGLAAYLQRSFGKGYHENLFCAQFNMAKVSRHVLFPTGSTFGTTDSDFVTSDNRDFHPTDVIVDSEGNLLILDTGGWYKLCCPSAQLSKKDVLGAIYRVRKLEPNNLIPRSMGEETLAIRRRFAEKLGRSTPPVEGAAAEILASLADRKVDAVLDAAYTRALIDIGDIASVRKGLSSSSPRVVRAALVALEQLPDAKLTFAELQPHLDAKDANLRDTAWWIAGRHPAWGKDLAAGFEKAIQSETADVERIVKFAGNAEVQAMLAENAQEFAAVEAMAKAKLKAPPASWSAAILKDMNPDQPSAVWLGAALVALRVLPAPDKDSNAWNKKLIRIARDTVRPADLRLLALVAARPATLDPVEFRLTLEHLPGDHPATLRADAAQILAGAALTAEQIQGVLAILPKVSPLDLEKLLPGLAKPATDSLGLALVEALDTAELRPALRGEQVTGLFAKHSKTVQSEAARLRVKLDDELKSRRSNLEKTLLALEPGDIRRGQLVFNSAKTNCATCHKIGYVGGTIGPDLTRIGGIRSEMDLLESIVVPSASFVRSYEPVQVTRLDGRSHSGILKKDSPDEVILTVSATEEVRIPRSEIDVLKPGTVSVMPAGLEKQITKQELADLLAFLKGLK